MLKIKYNLKFPISVYSACELNNKLYVGGSDWNRRKTPYNKKIADNYKGILYILSKNNFKILKKIIFPSMIYSIIKLDNNKLFVGCKSENGSFNIINLNDQIIKQKDDKIGRGVYNAVIDQKNIILATRSGNLEIIDDNLNLKKKIQLSNKKARLWSIKLDNKNIYLGDYDGILYIVNKRTFSIKK